MKRFHISIAVADFAASVADYNARLGCNPCVLQDGRYALWRTECVNFSISCKPDQVTGVVRHIGFEDDAAVGFSEDMDVNGIVWEHFSRESQLEEIREKFPGAVIPALCGDPEQEGSVAIRGPRPPHEAGVTMRLLTVADAEMLRYLRLRALKEHPEAFLDDYEEAKAWPIERFAQWFGNGWIAGAFSDGKLVAKAGLYREKGKKIQHKGTVWGVYAAPEMRGHGLGRRCIELVMDEARTAGVEQVMITTDVTNTITVGLYESLGFIAWGVEKHITKLPDRYIDDVVMTKFFV